MITRVRELWFVTARMRLLISVLAVLAVLFVGVAGYMIIEGDRNVGFLDALFMTVITVSTVGYNEVWKLSPAGRIWTVAVIGFGIITVSYAFTSLVTLAVSDESRALRERKKMTGPSRTSRTTWYSAVSAGWEA